MAINTAINQINKGQAHQSFTVSRQILKWLITSLGLLSATNVMATSVASNTINGADKVDQLLSYIDDLYQGEANTATIRMEIQTQHYSRTLKIESWSKGQDKALMKVLSPLKEKGTTTLKTDNEIWNYLPKINRVIKVPSSMMGAGWMGSHFTNDDLLKENRYVDDYTCDISRETQQTIIVACTPYESAALVWGRVDLVIDAQSRLPQQAIYLDESLQIARTMTFSDVKILSGRTLPTQLTITLAEKPGEKTTVTYEAIDFNVSLKDSLFTIAALKRASRQ